MRSVLFVFFFIAMPSLPVDPHKDWSDWLSEGQTLRTSGSYFAAAHAFRQALAIADRSDVSDPQRIALAEALAGTYAEAGQYADSEAVYRHALNLVAQIEGSASLDYAVLLASMVVLPTQTSVPEEQVQLLRRAISLNPLPASVQKRAIVRACLALILKTQKRYSEEESLLIDAVTDLSSSPTQYPRLLCGLVNNLAMLRLDQGRNDESIDLQQKSIRIAEENFGPAHPYLVTPLNNLAVLYMKVGRFAEAVVVYRRAMEICRESLGESHLDYAVLLENYAALLKKLGQKRQAKKFAAEGQQIEQASGRRNGAGVTVGITALRATTALR